MDVDSDKYRDTFKQEQFYGGEGGILGAMEKHILDLLMVPSSRGIANDLAAKMGFPVLGVPLGSYPDQGRAWDSVFADLDLQAFFGRRLDPGRACV